MLPLLENLQIGVVGVKRRRAVPPEEDWLPANPNDAVQVLCFEVAINDARRKLSKVFGYPYLLDLIEALKPVHEDCPQVDQVIRARLNQLLRCVQTPNENK